MSKRVAILLFLIVPFITQANNGLSALGKAYERMFIGGIGLTITVIGVVIFSQKRLLIQSKAFFYLTIASCVSGLALFSVIAQMMAENGPKPLSENSRFWFTLVIILAILTYMVFFTRKYKKLTSRKD